MKNGREDIECRVPLANDQRPKSKANGWHVYGKEKEKEKDGCNYLGV